MRKLITKDGSVTFHSEEYDETYHSVTGAVDESLKKFVEPALAVVKDKIAAGDEIRILDVCFGLGYNSAVAIDEILKLNISCDITIIGLEKDENILAQIKNVAPLIISYPVIEDMIEQGYNYDLNGIKIDLMIGDALETINEVTKETREANKKFDIILHDPFSPKKNPELWTKEFFKELRKLIAEDGILTTYSCAGQVRRNLKAAGFNVKDGPCVGRRAPSTIATPVRDTTKER